VLLWHSYPNIGVDSRNQFDMLRSLPGYPHGLQAMVRRFHERDVRVLLPYNPWDQGTNNSAQDDVHSLVDEIVLIGADGFNGQNERRGAAGPQCGHQCCGDRCSLLL
jgi:iron(II)-dependent oxidoreductase